MFELLSAKRMFKTWLIAKMFKGWHHNTRRGHFARVQQSLASQSFLAKPTFCKVVLQLRNITHEMAKVQLLDIQPGKAYKLEVGTLSCYLYMWVTCITLTTVCVKPDYWPDYSHTLCYTLPTSSKALNHTPSYGRQHAV